MVIHDGHVFNLIDLDEVDEEGLDCSRAAPRCGRAAGGAAIREERRVEAVVPEVLGCG